MLNEAKISRPRPGLWGQGRVRGQFLRVEAKAEGKDKVMNIKYQIIIYQHTDEFISLWSKRYSLISHSLSQGNYLQSFIVWCPVVGKQTGQSLLGCWFFCDRLRPGRGQMVEAEAEAKGLRPRPKLWPYFGLEDLTSLQLFGRWSCVRFLCIVKCNRGINTVFPRFPRVSDQQYIGM